MADTLKAGIEIVYIAAGGLGTSHSTYSNSNDFNDKYFYVIDPC
jgi:hypothetical protein